MGVAPQAVALGHPRALGLAARLAAELLPQGSDAAIRRESLVLALLAEVGTVRAKSSRAAPAWLASARAQLDEALGSEIRIGEVARTAGVHPVHLARVFRQFTGLTPGDYLRRRRLDYACTLLRETRRPMVEIALACGFVDQSHFATAFRRAYCVTPRLFRQG
jgi:AraC family transcriptional regulator